MPKEEQPAYRGGGMSPFLKSLRIKARSDLNHAVNQGKIFRQTCLKCGAEKTEAHHQDYTKPLNVMWLCDYHHHQIHKNPELLEVKQNEI